MKKLIHLHTPSQKVDIASRKICDIEFMIIQFAKMIEEIRLAVEAINIQSFPEFETKITKNKKTLTGFMCSALLRHKGIQILKCELFHSYEVMKSDHGMVNIFLGEVFKLETRVFHHMKDIDFLKKDVEEVQNAIKPILQAV